MTNAELAELRGEIFGVKVLLFNCLSFIASRFDDPMAHLAEIQQQAVVGIAQAIPAAIRPQHLQTFHHAAAGVVAQAIEEIRQAHSRVARPPTRQ